MEHTFTNFDNLFEFMDTIMNIRKVKEEVYRIGIYISRNIKVWASESLFSWNMKVCPETRSPDRKVSLILFYFPL